MIEPKEVIVKHGAGGSGSYEACQISGTVLESDR